jgi:hypothetical protein
VLRLALLPGSYALRDALAALGCVRELVGVLLVLATFGVALGHLLLSDVRDESIDLDDEGPPAVFFPPNEPGKQETALTAPPEAKERATEPCGDVQRAAKIAVTPEPNGHSVSPFACTSRK